MLFSSKTFKKFKKSSMYAEILEQSQVISKILRKYLPSDSTIPAFNLKLNEKICSHISNIYIVASGSSKNAGDIASYFMSKILKVPVFTDYASEFAHKTTNLSQTDIVIVISQSGETADTFSALKLAKEQGAVTIALTNNVNSKIHLMADNKIYLEAGVEKSIAATKSFMAQLLVIYILGLYLGMKRGTLSKTELDLLKIELYLLESHLNNLFNQENKIEKICSKIKKSKNLVILGRGINSALTKEGALKIKETCYIDANGYPSGEFLHGHLAFVDSKVPIISIIYKHSTCIKNYELALNNTKEIKKKRNPSLIIIKSCTDRDIENDKLLKDANFLEIPECSEEISPFYIIVLFQLIALKTAFKLNRNVDSPRDLQKAIISE